MFYSREISLSCTTQECEDVTTPYYAIVDLSSDRLREVKTEENFTLLALKGAAVPYERWSLTRGSKYNIVI